MRQAVSFLVDFEAATGAKWGLAPNAFAADSNPQSQRYVGGRRSKNAGRSEKTNDYEEESSMQIRPITLALGVALIGMTVPAGAQQQNPEQAIRDYVKTFQDTFNKKDAHSLAMMYTNDAVRILPSGQVVTGRQDIEKGLAEVVAQAGDLSLNVGKIEGSRGDLAWGYNSWTGVGKDQNGAPQKSHGFSALVWVHESDGWKTSLEGVIFIPNMPEAPK